MLIVCGFAFVAGVVTALSPCILPVLPAILSTATGHGRWRPLGAIIGLVVSFSFWTLLLGAIVQATGVPVLWLRYAAIALIGCFGIVMVSTKLSGWFAQLTSPIADAGQRIAQRPHEGLWGGLLFGAALGLIWTPCAGPVLAAITTLVASHAISGLAVAMTASYSLGAALPMLLIAYGGQAIIGSSRWLTSHTERIRQGFGILMIAFAIMLAGNWDMLLQAQLARLTPQFLTERGSAIEQQLASVRPGAVAVGDPAPPLVGITRWINSPPLTLGELRGKVVLIDFWTYSCINCLRTLPYLKQWDAAYRDRGLTIIGVHTPEFAFEKDASNVAAAVKHLGITYPVAMDNDYATWNAYHNAYWPAHYLIDQRGIITSIHFGEGEYVATENAIRGLLGLAPLKESEKVSSIRPITDETYLGSGRGHSMIAPTAPLEEGEVGLNGPWHIESEYVLATGPGCTIDLTYRAAQLYLVLGGASKEPIKVLLDGKAAAEVQVDGPRKYDVATGAYGVHHVRLEVPQGVKAYVFTFGDGG